MMVREKESDEATWWHSHKCVYAINAAPRSRGPWPEQHDKKGVSTETSLDPPLLGTPSTRSTRCQNCDRPRTIILRMLTRCVWVPTLARLAKSIAYCTKCCVRSLLGHPCFREPRECANNPTG